MAYENEYKSCKKQMLNLIKGYTILKDIIEYFADRYNYIYPTKNSINGYHITNVSNEKEIWISIDKTEYNGTDMAVVIAFMSTRDKTIRQSIVKTSTKEIIEIVEDYLTNE